MQRTAAHHMITTSHNTSQKVTNGYQSVINFYIFAPLMKCKSIFCTPIGKVSQIKSLRKDSYSTKDNTPAMPLNDAHLVGFFHLRGCL